MRRIFKAGFIVLFFIFLIVLQYFLVLKEPGREEVNINYNVEISANNSAYQIILPIPLKYDSTKNFDKGKIIETPYGKGIFIESRENLTLKANYNIIGHEMWNPMDFPEINLTCRNDWWSYWIYYNGSNGIFIDLTYIEYTDNPYIGSRYTTHINYTLISGWNTYNDTYPYSRTHGDKFGWDLEDAKKEACVFSIILSIICIITICIYIAIGNKKSIENKNIK